MIQLASMKNHVTGEKWQALRMFDRMDPGFRE
jgi:hypothetical protein